MGVIATKIGASHISSERQMVVLERTAHRGRNWTVTVCTAALDLLSNGTTTELTSTERSRLKNRIRSCEVGALAGQILRGRVTVRRAASDDAKNRFVRLLASELDLSTAGGIGVFVINDAIREARRAHLGLDDEGDIVVVEGNEIHRSVLEAFALYVYGGARESSAARQWVEAKRRAL